VRLKAKTLDLVFDVVFLPLVLFVVKFEPTLFFPVYGILHNVKADDWYQLCCKVREVTGQNEWENSHVEY